MPPYRRRKKLKRPVKLFDLINARTRRWRVQKLQRIEIIRQKWVEAAGEYVAEHVIPVRLVRKTLRVSAPDSGWVNEMNYLAATIVERLQELLPGPWVEEIRTVVGEIPATATRTRAETDDKVLPQATPEMVERAGEVGTNLKDQELAGSIRRAMVSSLRLDAKRNNAVEKKKKQTNDGEQS
jgi:hypothetical protein